MKDAYNHVNEIMTYNSCADACEHCIALCLSEKSATYFRCIELCRDCADLCRQTAIFMLRNSDYADVCAQLCRVACLACAEECLSHDATHCQACAQSCQACADEVLINDPGNEDPGSLIEDERAPS
ncbi:four-helix bundle copper-binding protein [Pseudomonas sp. AA-38]|uniref:four-helix bundle copper-binding protein n=1 Tax=Pseudomonas sp. AA-38 TaxID=3028807 RepID=UPI0023F73BC0|nr:four-helix bundle copper-binding protein [Pseudomonas sp. AA-38]